MTDALQEVTAELEQAEARIEELEGKLAKAVALLDRAMGEGKVYEDDFSGWCDMMDRIAELKGQDDGQAMV